MTDSALNSFTPNALTAIVPSNDLDASERFYLRLGFTRPASQPADDNYRILCDGRGGWLHLSAAVPGWLTPGSNPFALFLYTPAVDALAAAFPGEIIGSGLQDQSWGMYEFAVSDPDGTLVRIGWPSRLRRLRNEARD
jgi:hypothetical protein